MTRVDDLSSGVGVGAGGDGGADADAVLSTVCPTSPETGTSATSLLAGPAAVWSKCHNAAMMEADNPPCRPRFRCVMKYVSVDVWLQEKPKSKIESH